MFLNFVSFIVSIIITYQIPQIQTKTVSLTLTIDQVYVVIQGYEKTIAAFNGSFPGPEIRVNLGDVLKIKVINNLHREIVSVHWHGLSVSNNPYMDGVAYITQCGIYPMESFTYVVATDRAGTYWYHGHVAEDRTDSMFGSIVIVPPSYPFQFDTELVWQLSDFYTAYDVQINAGLEAYPFRFPGNPFAFPLNGVIGPNYSLQPNKTYLIRLINAGALSWHNFSIAGHSLKIVEVQGSYTQPLTVTNIYINNGERVSFLLTTNNPGCWQVKYNMLGPGRSGTGVAYLGYVGSNCNASNPQSYVAPSTNQVWNQNLLVARNDMPFTLPIPNKIIPLFVKQVRTGSVNPSIKWSINNYTFVHPGTPLIFSYYYNSRISAASFPVLSTEGEIVKRTYIIDIHYGDVIDFYYYNLPRSWDGNTEQHPMHFHGHSFWLLGSGANGTNMTLNLVNPIKIDTFTLPAYGWAVVRLQADNPGIWMVHCHIAWHNRMGMAFVLAYPSRTLPAPPNDFPVCGDLSCKTVDIDSQFWSRHPNSNYRDRDDDYN